MKIQRELLEGKKALADGIALADANSRQTVISDDAAPQGVV